MGQNDMVNELVGKIHQKIGEIKEIYETLQNLKKYGTNNVDLPDLVSLLKSNGQADLLTIHPDAFYRLSNTEAAKEYLRKIGHAVSLGEIYDALVKGGVQFKGDGKKNLNVQLTRATKIFAKIGSGESGVSFGLVEWYRKPRRIKTEDSGIGSEETHLEIEDDFTAEGKAKEEEKTQE